MILLINSQNHHLYADLLDDMFRVRADVFKKRLNWDVTVENDREIDMFDKADPTYVVSVCEMTGAFQGSVRLLPTMGPNMLRDVFPQLLDGDQIVSDSKIWESSRFSINANQPQMRCRKGAARFIHKTTVELLLGIIECAQLYDITQIVSVYDARMVRVFRQIGCDATPVGTPKMIGEIMTHAGIFETTEDSWAKIASSADITERVVGGELPLAIAFTQAILPSFEDLIY